LYHTIGSFYWGSKPQFEGLEFKCKSSLDLQIFLNINYIIDIFSESGYNMSLETQINFPGGDLGNCNAGDYEHTFAGVEESMEELSGKSVSFCYLNQC
jgi:hypothetical protein